MSDTQPKPKSGSDPNVKPAPLKPSPSGVPTHELPEVKPLIDKARSDPARRIPEGTIRTGADVVGGGGTKTLDHDHTIKRPGTK